MTPQAPTLARDDREAIRAAAEWYARLGSGAAGDGVNEAWQGWLAASELHRRAWMQVEHVCGQFSRVPGPLAGHALRGGGSHRRAVLCSLLLAGAAMPLAWQLGHSTPWRVWQASRQTRVGERRPFTLDDGSLLVMDTDSALDVVFDARQRLIHLHRGRVLIATARDAGAAAGGVGRPFRVRTGHGLVEALGTRFTVRTHADLSQVAVIEDRVRVMQNGTAGDGTLVGAGQQLDFGLPAGAGPEPSGPVTAAWVTGSLVAVDMPLGEWVAELGRYRRGVLRCDPAVAGLRVSGAFPLDDTDRALQLLADTFPVRHVWRTRYWVSVEAA